MPISMHSHSGQFCKHASGLLEDVVLEAIRQDFKVYGLSEHVPRYRAKDLYPEEVGQCSRAKQPVTDMQEKANLSLGELAHQFSSFVDEAHRLKTKYAEQIILLVGAETEFISEPDMDFLAVLLEHYGPKIEYLVGSVHHANEIPIDFDPETFDRALSSFASSSDLNPEELLISHYLDRQYELLRRFRPAVVGHMDLFRLYRPSLELNGYSSLPPKLLRNIDYACNYGALFELNAAAFRKGWNTAYPGKDIVAVCIHKVAPCGN